MGPRLDEFEVVSVVGRGTNGTVRKVRRRSDGKDLVWKELHYANMTDPEKQGLVQEVNLLRELRHPHIVRFLQHIVDKRSATLYIIMEHCPGGDLRHLITRCLTTHARLHEAFVWKILKQLSEALHACHSGKRLVLHRDIKPANVFLDQDANVKLGDFGLARTLSSHASFATSFVGTPYYMSPEVVEGREYNEKSDMWSLGCLVYELCALQPPFQASSHKLLAAKIRAAKYDRIPKQYSEELWKVVQLLLTHEDFLRPTALMILYHKALQTFAPSSPCDQRDESQVADSLRNDREKRKVTDSQRDAMKERNVADGHRDSMEERNVADERCNDREDGIMESTRCQTRGDNVVDCFAECKHRCENENPCRFEKHKYGNTNTGICVENETVRQCCDSATKVAPNSKHGHLKTKRYERYMKDKSDQIQNVEANRNSPLAYEGLNENISENVNVQAINVINNAYNIVTSETVLSRRVVNSSKIQRSLSRISELDVENSSDSAVITPMSSINLILAKNGSTYDSSNNVSAELQDCLDSSLSPEVLLATRAKAENEDLAQQNKETRRMSREKICTDGDTLIGYVEKSESNFAIRIGVEKVSVCGNPVTDKIDSLDRDISSHSEEIVNNMQTCNAKYETFIRGKEELSDVSCSDSEESIISVRSVRRDVGKDESQVKNVDLLGSKETEFENYITESTASCGGFKSRDRNASPAEICNIIKVEPKEKVIVDAKSSSEDNINEINTSTDVHPTHTPRYLETSIDLTDDLLEENNKNGLNANYIKREECACGGMLKKEWKVKLAALRDAELAVRERERDLEERQRELIICEKKIAVVEQDAKQNLVRAQIYLRHVKNKNPLVGVFPPHTTPAMAGYRYSAWSDTTLSAADSVDSPAIRTAARLDPALLHNPFTEMRIAGPLAPTQPLVQPQHPQQDTRSDGKLRSLHRVSSVSNENTVKCNVSFEKRSRTLDNPKSREKKGSSAYSLEIGIQTEHCVKPKVMSGTSVNNPTSQLKLRSNNIFSSFRSGYKSSKNETKDKVTKSSFRILPTKKAIKKSDSHNSKGGTDSAYDKENLQPTNTVCEVAHTNTRLLGQPSGNVRFYVV